MCLFYYCNFALGECELYKGITNYIYNNYWGSTNYIYNRYWGVQIPGSTYYMLHRPVWLGLRRGAFTCVGWQVTLCDPIWQVTPCSSEMGFP